MPSGSRPLQPMSLARTPGLRRHPPGPPAANIGPHCPTIAPALKCRQRSVQRGSQAVICGVPLMSRRRGTSHEPSLMTCALLVTSWAGQVPRKPAGPQGATGTPSKVRHAQLFTLPALPSSSLPIHTRVLFLPRVQAWTRIGGALA